MENFSQILKSWAVYANYIGPPVMTDANSVGPVKGSLYVMIKLLKMTDVMCHKNNWSTLPGHLHIICIHCFCQIMSFMSLTRSANVCEPPD